MTVLTKIELKEWYNAGFTGIAKPEPNYPGGPLEYCFECGQENAQDAVVDGFEEVYEYHFEDLVRDKEER